MAGRGERHESTRHESKMARPKALFYLTPQTASVRSFVAHGGKIDIVVPAVYSADEQGAVSGATEARVLEAAARHGVAVMPIVVNPGFRQETVHQMLASAEARERVAKGLLEECRQRHYWGMQLDFENVPAADREALTALVRDTAALLGRDGFRLSIAVMYQTASQAPGQGYARWLWENWLGAYDLPEIAKHVEFVSVMTYDQHTERTPPGPIAAYGWVEQVLDHCLPLVGKEKLSLGIPLYGRLWYAGTVGGGGAMLTSTVTAHEAAELAIGRKVEPQWDAEARAPWFSFYRDGVREYVFYNDARAFRERYGLAERRGLHGFSAWVLGAEDPDIWRELPAAAR